MNQSEDITESLRIANEIGDECVGVRVRMLNRAVSRLYDEMLRPHGIKFSQMNILTAVALRGPVQPIALARLLSMEKSTLSRNVRILAANGWLQSRGGRSGNTQLLELTADGRRLLRAAAPAWREAQARVKAALGARTTQAIRSAADRLWDSQTF